MASPDPRVFTIPSGASFLPTLADALTHGRILEGLRDPAVLAQATIYLPTRRAARALASLLAEHGQARAQLLPHIVPLGEADGAEFELAAGAPGDTAFEGAETLAPPIAPLERRLILTRLIQLWADTLDRARLRLAADAPLLVPSRRPTRSASRAISRGSWTRSRPRTFRGLNSPKRSRPITRNISV